MPPSHSPEDFRRMFQFRLVLNKQTGCMEWTGGRVGSRYGRVRYQRRAELAHRVAYILAHGEIPEGQYVLHRCDNPPCCNPDHLFLGDQFINMDDMRSKGRAYDRSGSRNGSAKLTEDAVREIRRLKADGVAQAELARRFGVSTVAISLIVLRKKWVHVI